jgi:hypothetical protein
MRYVMRVAVLALTVVGLLVSASAAGAATAPGYEEFDGCPGRDVNPDISLCAVTKVSGGHLQMGGKTVPITDPITLAESVAPSTQVFVGEFDGGRQAVPGGLVGVTGLDWLVNIFPANLLKLYARSELAGTPSNPIQDPVTLPLKVRLENPLLSRHCYIGSNADPITLNLTQYVTNPPPPNQPINGTPGSFIADPVLTNVFRLQDATVVDNAFAAPQARGCTLLVPGLGVIDPIVNLQAGLPSPAGTNEASQDVDLGLAEIQTVYPPDGFE